ncbi:MAG: T9SS type A sorting domain-containing protein, partial [Bacteroidales bacterium]|nr:T9SS type A sorting domain-containing protein [Bacteroidales bacterium]
CGSETAYRNAPVWDAFSYNIIGDASPLTISVQSNNNIMGNANIVQENTCVNNTAVIEATPNTGYRFVQWNDGNRQNPRTVTLSSDTAFTAVFGVAGLFQLSVFSNNTGMGTVMGSGDYATNSTATISATAHTGYRFVQWNDGNTNNLRTLTVIQDTTFTAEFEALIYVALVPNDPIMGTLTGEGYYIKDSAAIIAAIPSAGYRFVQWNDGDTNNPRTLTAIQDTSFTAEFEALIYVALVPNDPTMGILTGAGYYIKDSAAIIAAIPNAGYRFVQWNDGNKNNPRTLTATQDTTFTAEFEALIYVALVPNDPIMGILTGAGYYIKDSAAIIEAIPNAGYRFVQWNDGNKNNPRTITATQDTTFTAEFEAYLYVTLVPNDPIMGSLTGAGYYIKDSTAIIEAIPNAGYRFVQWNDGDTNNPRTITVTQDITFTATFEAYLYVTLVPNDPVMGTLTGEGYYIKDSTAIIEAIPNAGYRFVQWNDGNKNNPRAITVTQNITFTAEFEAYLYVTLVPNDPIMGSLTGAGYYIKDSTAVIEAIPNTGYRFVQWNDGNKNNPRTITVTQDTAFTAIFGQAGMFQLSVFSNNTGMGTVSGSGDYAVNSTATINAAPNTGYRFLQWNDGNTQNPRTITITQDTIFTATFEALLYVTLVPNDPTMGILTGAGYYIKDSTAIIEAIPNAGYRFLQWNDGNTQNPRTITVTQDTTFTAAFEVMMYHVTVTANDAAMGSVTGSGDYAVNSTITITATPNAGYRFVAWNGGDTQSSRAITVTQDTTFTARFEKGVGIIDVVASTINVYPNPATDNINIILPENVTQATFTLYDTQGKMLIRQEVNNQDVIQVSNLASGIYIYNVGTEKESYQGKIIKP